MAKKSIAAKIRAYMTAHPTAKSFDIAAKFDVKPTYVYVIRSQMKKTAINPELKEPWAPPPVLPVPPAPTPIPTP
jgi:hypothetical protein